MMRIGRAPAKINLTLRVLGRRADGFHELESLVAFAGVCDLVAFDPHKPFGLDVEGPMAEAAGPEQDNLVIRAARALEKRVPGLKLGRFSLQKKLPVGAGIGGGSSDAAAALRLLAAHNALAAEDARIFAAAAETGSDIPVCLAPAARMFGGRGEEVGPPAGLPPLVAVLVNPGVHVSTAEVFRALDLKPGQTVAAPSQRQYGPDASGLIEAIARDSNDLEAPARALSPVITRALDDLRAVPNVRLVRMSGSGSTVFGLFEHCRDAVRAARSLRAAHPAWWVRPTMLR